MQKIMYTRANDGGVSILTPTAKENIERDLGVSLSDIEYENIIRSSIPADALTPVDIEEDIIPKEEEMFYKAWKQNNDKIDIDLNIAKDIQLDRMRKERDPLLAALDVEYVKADEQEDVTRKDEIKTEKQRLRDITEPLKAMVPESLDDIKNAYPEEFN